MRDGSQGRGVYGDKWRSLVLVQACVDFSTVAWPSLFLFFFRFFFLFFALCFFVLTLVPLL